MTPEGEKPNLQEKANAESTPGGGITQSANLRGEVTSPIDSASVKNIPQTGGKSKTEFSMKAPVEEAEDLIVLHNLSTEKLGKALNIGGFPMPSIAVTKTSISHTNFGNITLPSLLRKQKITRPC